MQGIQWGNFLSSWYQVILVLYVIQSTLLLPFAYKSFPGYMISLLTMVVIPSLFLFALSFVIGDNRGGNGYDYYLAELFLVSSGIHTVFIFILLFFQKKKEHWIKLYISLSLVVFTSMLIYAKLYM